LQTERAVAGILVRKNELGDFCWPARMRVLFVHGCFWHGCPRHYREPRSNRAFWAGKIARNRGRDRRTVAALRRAGWSVMVVWEHELRDPERVRRRLRLFLGDDNGR